MSLHRRFLVADRNEGPRGARVFAELSFEAAAIAYLDDHPVGAEHEISLTVRDLDTGTEHCFRIDLDTGATRPCD